MLSQGEISSPNNVSSTRHLLNAYISPKIQRKSQFNARLFERHAVDREEGDGFGLKDACVQYEWKGKQMNGAWKDACFWALWNALLSALAIFCMIVDNELVFLNRLPPLHSNALRILVICVSVLQIAVTAKLAQLQLQLRILQGRRHPKSTTLVRFVTV